MKTATTTPARKLSPAQRRQLCEDLESTPYYSRAQYWESMRIDLECDGYNLHWKTIEMFESIAYGGC